MDVKHRKETSVGWLRIMLTTLILIFAVPFSTMFADEPEMESRAVGETVDSAPNVTIIRANGDVATYGSRRMGLPWESLNGFLTKPE